MISVIDVGISNIRSITKALDTISAPYALVNTPSELSVASKIIFPGVGSFPAAMARIHELKLFDILVSKLLNQTPYLGICLGMQLLSIAGYEGGCTRGLGIIDAEVTRIKHQDAFRIPHMGWNSVNSAGLKIMPASPSVNDYYFVHSYHMKVNDPHVKLTFFKYGQDEMVAAIQKGNIFGTQFHPEKSQLAGKIVFSRFVQEC
jgi:glutamine amidotransferase